MDNMAIEQGRAEQEAAKVRSQSLKSQTITYTPWNITQPLKRIHLNQF